MKHPNLSAVTAMRGMAWLAGGYATARVSTVIAHAALGRWLSPAEFGLYAEAIGFALVAQVIQDSGIRELIVTPQTAVSEQTVTDIFWMGTGLNTAAVSLSFLTALAFTSSDVLLPLAAILVGVLLSAVWNVQRNLLRRSELFQPLSAIESLSSLCQSILSVAMGFTGFGASAIAVPQGAVPLLRGAGGLAVTSERPWLRLPSFSGIRTLLPSSAWLTAGALGQASFQTGDYLLLSFFLDEDQLGIYFFGYQVMNVAASIIGSSLFGAVLPGLSSKRLGVARVPQLMMTASFITGLMSVGLYVAFTIADEVLWGGTWTAAYPLVAIFTALPILNILWAVGKSLLLAEQRFEAWAGVSVLTGGVAIAALGLGAAMLKTIEGPAIIAIVSFAMAATVLGVVASRTREFSGAKAVFAVFLGGVPALAALWSINFFGTHLDDVSLALAIIASIALLIGYYVTVVRPLGVSVMDILDIVR